MTKRVDNGEAWRPQQLTVADLVARAGRLAEQGERRILGITGAPGAGKSTVAAQVVAALGPGRAVHVGMDGFHLSNAVLIALGRRDRKGAIDTFDAQGYGVLLTRLRAARAGQPPIYAPDFDRDLEESVAGGISVPAEVPLVVTEGNYLLADAPGWREVRARLDEVWFLAPVEDVRVDRLVARHMAHGKVADKARAWTLGPDQVNAELIAASSGAADLVIEVV